MPPGTRCWLYEGARIYCVDLQDTLNAKLVDSIDTSTFVRTVANFSSRSTAAQKLELSADEHCHCAIASRCMENDG